MSLITDYIATCQPAEQREFNRLSEIAKRLVPDYTEGVSYGMSAFMYKGKPFFGFVAAKKHLSIFPFSGSVLDSIKDELSGFEYSQGTLRFTLDRVIPEHIVESVIATRLKEIDTQLTKK